VRHIENASHCLPLKPHFDFYELFVTHPEVEFGVDSWIEKSYKILILIKSNLMEGKV
jgi:hypothetical protein